MLTTSRMHESRLLRLPNISCKSLLDTPSLAIMSGKGHVTRQAVSSKEGKWCMQAGSS